MEGATERRRRLRDVRASTDLRAFAQRLRQAAVWAAPYGLIERRRRHEDERLAAAVDRVREQRRRLIRSVTPPARGDTLFDYDAAVAFLVDKGLDETQVREGSMPRESLDFVGKLLAEHLPEKPLL